MKTRLRRQKILSSLRKEKRLYISDLARQFTVSTMTIRRDLTLLAAQDIATLVPGGAVLNEGSAWIIGTSARTHLMNPAKNAIALACSQLIKEGNAVFIDAGTTMQRIAETLVNRQNIAVITHSRPVLNILCHAHGLQLISIPGIYDEHIDGFTGDMARRTIEEFHIDIAFLGTGSIDAATNELSSASMADVNIKRAVLRQSRRTVAAFDHTKIGQVSFMKVAGLQDLSTIVTDHAADKDFIARARRLGLEIIQT
jgi:DeoR/GlpR family transcriptional regulator of sugar metabolism